MHLISFLLILACTVTVSYATVGHICLNDVECDQGECCQILSKIQVVSRKRQLDWMTTTPGGTTGTCELYQPEGSSCNTLDKPNGYCSCAPGTRCTEVEDPTTTTTEAPPCFDDDEPTFTTPRLGKRSPPRPGYSWICKP